MPWTAVRFGAVGLCNTAIDWVLFVWLHQPLGITFANFCSTSVGMAFSFVVNGLFTFRAERLTVRHAGLFLATTGATMWVAQPLLIHGFLRALELLAQPGGQGFLGDPDHRVWIAKLAAIAGSLALNFLAYRHLVWPAGERHTT